ncbi:MAG: zinc-binding dehydrogenase, partial [Desulfobacterales bacterium]
MTAAIPSEMRVLELQNYDEDIATAVHSLRVVRKPTPRPGPGQVLVRIEAAPCNPSDLVFMQGLYGVKKPLPAVPGWEGAGTVVASGGGLMGKWLTGRRVACGGQSDADGTWAEYYIADVKSCVPLRKGISSEQGATLIINPLTAWAMVDTAQKGGHRAIVQTAAASQLGQMVVRLAQDAGIALINVVRRQEQEDVLRSSGAKVVLNSESEDFEARLREECLRLKATMGFDAVCGEMTGKIFSAMAPGATVLVYGVLSFEPAGGLDGRDLIFGRKRVEGFWLTDWIRKAGFLRVFQATGQIQKRFADGSFATQVRKKLRLEDVPAAILEYQQEMTAGKILISPGQ